MEPLRRHVIVSPVLKDKFLQLSVFSISSAQEQQVVLCQWLQQQRQRELQRLTLTGALTSTPTSPMIAQSPNLLSSATASPLQGGQGGSLFGLQDNVHHKPGVSSSAATVSCRVSQLWK